MQNHYNLVYREEEREMIPLCIEEGIGVIPWSPLARGFLTGSRTRDVRRPTARAQADPFADELYFQEDDFRVLDALLEMARDRGVKPAQIALAWLLSVSGRERSDRRRDPRRVSRRCNRRGRPETNGRGDRKARGVLPASPDPGAHPTAATGPAGMRAIEKETMMRRMFLFVTAALCAVGTLASAEGIEQSFTFDGEELVVANLVGKVRIEPADGSNFDVAVSVRGRDAAPGKITFEKTDGAKARLAIRFPVDKESRFIYPEMGTDFNTTINVSNGNQHGVDWLRLVFPGSHDRVRIASKGKGLEIWADVTVKLPRGKRLEIRHGAGAIETQGTVGGMLLDSHCGPVTVARSEGALSIDTGSGEVRVSDSNGELTVDTGSGSVDLTRCRATGLDVDTGSGSVHATEIECDAMKIDTGSGDVAVLLTRMGGGNYLIDTGSGSVDLRVPVDASARYSADSGAGKIDVDLPGTQIHKGSADDLTFKTGAGSASVRIDTGAGSIRVGVTNP